MEKSTAQQPPIQEKNKIQEKEFKEVTNTSSINSANQDYCVSRFQQPRIAGRRRSPTTQAPTDGLGVLPLPNMNKGQFRPIWSCMASAALPQDCCQSAAMLAQYAQNDAENCLAEFVGFALYAKTSSDVRAALPFRKWLAFYGLLASLCIQPFTVKQPAHSKVHPCCYKAGVKDSSIGRASERSGEEYRSWPLFWVKAPSADNPKSKTWLLS